MAKPKTKSSAEIVADAIGWDIADVENLRYQSTRTTTPVWALDDECFTVTRGKQKPSTSHKGWVPFTKGIPAPEGCTVWVVGTAAENDGES